MPIITLELPELDEDEFEYSDEALATFLNENIEILSEAFDLDLNDDRAQVDEVEVSYASIGGDQILIHYTIQYSAYYGCRDMNYDDKDERSLRGRVRGRILEFDAFVSPEPRSTFEEF